MCPPVGRRIHRIADHLGAADRPRVHSLAQAGTTAAAAAAAADWWTGEMVEVRLTLSKCTAFPMACSTCSTPVSHRSPPRVVLDAAAQWRGMLAEPPAAVTERHPEMLLTWLRPFGLAVTGLQLATTPLDADTAAYLDAVMAVHGIVVFRGQGRLPAKVQLAVTSQFGSGVIYSTHAVHKRAEHTEVFRLSNDP